MDRLKYVKVKQIDGSYTDPIPVGVDAENVDMSDGTTLASTLDSFATKADVANAYIYKGSVDSVSALPVSAPVGSVYNVAADGMNYAYTGDG